MAHEKDVTTSFCLVMQNVGPAVAKAIQNALHAKYPEMVQMDILQPALSTAHDGVCREAAADGAVEAAEGVAKMMTPSNGSICHNPKCVQVQDKIVAMSSLVWCEKCKVASYCSISCLMAHKQAHLNGDGGASKCRDLVNYVMLRISSLCLRQCSVPSGALMMSASLDLARETVLRQYMINSSVAHSKLVASMVDDQHVDGADDEIHGLLTLRLFLASTCLPGTLVVHAEKDNETVECVPWASCNRTFCPRCKTKVGSLLELWLCPTCSLRMCCLACSTSFHSPKLCQKSKVQIERLRAKMHCVYGMSMKKLGLYSGAP